MAAPTQVGNLVATAGTTEITITFDCCPNDSFDTVESLSHWIFRSNSQGETVTVDSGKLHLDVPDGVDGAASEYYKYLVPAGNTVIEVDLSAYTPDDTTDGLFVELALFDEARSDYGRIHYNITTAGSVHVVEGKFRLNDVNDYGTPDNPVSRPSKFRITRTGTTISVDYYISSWISAHSKDFGADAADLKEIRLSIRDNTLSGGSGEWDNLTITQDNANTYNLYHANATGVTQGTGTKITNCVSPYLHEGLIPGLTYYYVVTGVNTDGESVDSSEANATLAFAAPANLIATAEEMDIQLTWDSVAGTALYNGYHAFTTGLTKSTGTKLTNITSPYLHTNLIEGTTYYYIVTAENISGETADSSEVSATTLITGAETPESLPVEVIYENIAYRLNIAKDIHARTEDISFWSSAEILRAINEGYLDFVRRTLCLQKFHIIGLTEDTGEYDLPSDCIKIIWVGYDNKKLIGRSLRYMNELDEEWMDQSGTPNYYVQELSGIKKLRLYETPDITGAATHTADTDNDSGADADTGIIVSAIEDSTYKTFDADIGLITRITESDVLAWEGDIGIIIHIESHDDNLILLYAYEPPLFETLEDTTLPHVLANYQYALVFFALSELYLKEGDSQHLGLANFYKQLYEEAVTNRKETVAISNLDIMIGQPGVKEYYPTMGPFLPRDQYPLE